MQSQRYLQLSVWAFALAAGCAALIGTFLIGIPMFGMMRGAHGGMMGGGYGSMMGGGSMGPYGAHLGGGFGLWSLFGLGCWIGTAICVAIIGALFALIYNAIVRKQKI